VKAELDWPIARVVGVTVLDRKTIDLADSYCTSFDLVLVRIEDEPHPHPPRWIATSRLQPEEPTT